MNEQKINETVEALRLGVCTLIYTKIDGEVRQATGTLDPHLIPGEFHPKTKVHDCIGDDCIKCRKGVYQLVPLLYDDILHCNVCDAPIARWTPYQIQGELIHYFDLGSNGWRCFRMENLQSLSLQI